MICQKCQIEYDERRRFCRRCGSPLSGLKKTSPQDCLSSTERVRIVRVCPRCQIQFEVGNYCRVCGSSLKIETLSLEKERIPEKKLIKSLSSEWSRLAKKKQELDLCLESLEAQRDSLSEDIFNPLLLRYQIQAESLSSRLGEIETKLEELRIKLSTMVHLSEEEGATIRKRSEEIRSLRQLGVLTRSDYLTERKIIREDMRSTAKRLREYRKATSLFRSPQELIPVLPRAAGSFVRPQFSVVTAGIFLLVALGTYLLWTRNVIISHPKEAAPLSQIKFSAKGHPSVKLAEVADNEKIKSLFETIRQANLEKKIDLFMSCYASDFKDRDGKRSGALKNWESFDYLDLSFELRNLTVTGPSAQVRVEWRIHVSPKGGESPQETTNLLDVSLKKENGQWKIEGIKPVA